MHTIGFIGAGTVGTALAIRLREKGYPVIAVASRTRTSAERLASMVDGCQVHENGQAVADVAEMVFITTPDDAIAQVAAQVQWHSGQSVIHCSGAESVDILEPATRAAAQAGAFHPLQTLASIAQAIENIPGSCFALEAQEPLLGTLKGMVDALGGWAIELKPGDKVLYHAAAVIACNYLVTLVKLATDLWQTFNVPPSEATRALLPLLRGTVNNVDNVGLPNCLTGPVARGDLGTIRKHLTALEASAPEVLPAYCELGRQTVPISLAKGKIDETRSAELLELFNRSSSGGDSK
ncbi:MAG: DUF2520 domain-containing protein [Chloroflexi bacterium]|nr:MAG: DUF2520 domain-containing protein [Chloroflexota bacterium]RLC96626.1 MAG: DUF2520 domain-containing protein [Chloroflexota bacterium]